MLAISQTLEAVFRQIERQRMQDMPMCNPLLRVEAVGFREWGQYYLGVLVTPWFMNLMLLPADSSVMASQVAGNKQVHVFPSGRYEFICGHETELGDYQMCSLFSPMFEFHDQATVVDTANSVLDEMMQVHNRDTVSTQEKTIQKLWQETPGPETAAVETEISEQKVTEKLEAPISRRDFLRAGRSRDGDPCRDD